MRDPDGTTLLHKAILEGGRPELVRVLLGGGADPNLQTSNGWTALHLAVGCNAPQSTLRLLIAHGADIEAKDAEGKRPYTSPVNSPPHTRSLTF